MHNDLALATGDTNDSYWCTNAPNVPRAWSSSSLDKLMQCPFKFYVLYSQGWRARETAPQTFGKLYHKALDFYDKTIAMGEPREDAILHTTHYVARLCDSWVTDDTTRNWFTLLRAVLWNIDHFRDSPLKTIEIDGKPAIEVSFKILLPLLNPDGEQYILHGYMDRLVEYAGRPAVMDRKTTAWAVSDNYWSGYSPSNQPSCYTLAASIHLDQPFDGMLIEVAELKVGFTRFHRDFTSRSPSQLEEWLGQVMWWIKAYEKMATEGEFPMNFAGCHQYGGCELRFICSKSPESRVDLLHGEPKWAVARRTTLDRKAD